MLILGEKLYTQSDVDDILSENERLKRENEELKEKSDKLLQNFLDFESFSRKIGTVPDIVLKDGNGAYIKKIHGVPNGDNSCDCDKFRERIEKLKEENRKLKWENEDLLGKIAAFEIVMGDLKLWYAKNGYAPDVEIRRADRKKEYSEKEICDCGKLREKIEELKSKIDDMKKQYDGLRDEHETVCLERENLAKRLDEEKKKCQKMQQTLIAALNMWEFCKERLNQEMAKHNEQKRSFKTKRANRKLKKRK